LEGKDFFLRLALGLVPVTNNLKEFERVPALETENWISAAV
jgi:predicted nucleic acid-binding protein